MSSTFHKCRLCLKLGDFCSIFEQDESIKLSDMVMAFTSIQIYEGDGLSDRVCTSCIENLSTAYLFKQQCERIDSMLRKAPDTNINNPAAADYKDLFYQELHVHRDCNEDFIEGEITQNAMNDVKSEPIYAVANKHPHEISDDTDSDMDSVKCVCCNQSYSTMGPHTCLVQCTIEHNHLQRSSSNETLVASDLSPIRRPEPINRPQPPVPERPAIVSVTCVLCDEKYDQYNDYVTHLNKCTTNVKLHHFVCPVCHEMHSNKPTFLEHLKDVHFPMQSSDSEGQDCVDFAPTFDHPKKMKSVRRQIGWSIEDIYQEIDCKKPEELNVNLKDSPASSVFFDKQTPTSSPLKKFFSKFGNE